MLRPNDTIFRDGDYHHTMILVDPKSFQDVPTLLSRPEVEMEIIHAASVDSGVVREVMDIETEESSGRRFNVYRPMDERLQFGLTCAKAWAPFRTSAGKLKNTKESKVSRYTKYSFERKDRSEIVSSRYYGVQMFRSADICPPFEYDSLYRATKWACKLREPFSKNRGTTCCAFITACYQASVIGVLAGSNFSKMNTAFQYLKENREMKVPLHVRQTQYVESGPRKIAWQATQQYSNSGDITHGDNKKSVDAYCQDVTEILCGRRLTVAQTFPPALVVDAKFNYSANFERMIRRPHSGWQRIL